jgi:Leucine-rich repeat (LRR) protein
MQSLKQLILGYNHFTSFLEKILGLKNLELLDLSNNQNEYLPDNLSQLPLKTLKSKEKNYEKFIFIHYYFIF